MLQNVDLERYKHKLLKIEGKLGANGRYFTTSGLWTISSETIGMIAGLVGTVILTRTMSQDSFGQYQLIIAIISLLSVLKITGFDTVLFRDAALNKDGTYVKVLRERRLWSLLATPSLIVTGLYYFWQGNLMVSTTIFSVSLFIPILFYWESWQSFTKGKKRFDLIAKYAVAQSVGMMVFLILASYLSRGNVVVVVLAYYAWLMLVNWAGFKNSKQLIKTIVYSEDWRAYGYFIAKRGLFKFTMQHVDKVLVGLIFSPSVLAVYAVAIIVPSRVAKFSERLVEILMPISARKRSVALVEVMIAALFGVFLCAMVMLGSWLYINFLIGEEFRGALQLAFVASLILIMHPLYVYAHNWVTVQGVKKAVTYSYVVTPLVRLVMMLLLVKFWGVMGFAIIYALYPLLRLIFLFTALRLNLRERCIYIA